jgi:hypothetical protein
MEPLVLMDRAGRGDVIIMDDGWSASRIGGRWERGIKGPSSVSEMEDDFVRAPEEMASALLTEARNALSSSLPRGPTTTIAKIIGDVAELATEPPR